MRRENFLEAASTDAAAARGGAGSVLDWNRLALQAIRGLQAGPAAHTLALLHTCMYNAWAAYDGSARQTVHGVAVRLPLAERGAASKAAAIGHAAHAVLVARFPGRRAVFDAWIGRAGLPAAAGGDPLGPAAIGRAQAAALHAWCRAAGTDRVGGLVGAGAVDLPPARAPVIEPAPGRWCLPARLLSTAQGYGDDQDVRLFFALANALADAGMLAVNGGLGGAAAEVMRRFSGEPRGPARCWMAATAGQAAGRQAGALAFEAARRHWEGRL